MLSPSLTDLNDGGNSELSSRPTAIVIGAGPAGLSVSLGLSLRGWKVVLVEKYESFEVRGASFGMAWNGRKALEEISPGCVEEGMIASGKAIELPGKKSLLLPWWMMRDALLDEVRKTSIDLRTGMSVQTIEDDPLANHVQAQFVTGEHIEGDLLIGADGVHSSVRDILGLPPNELTGSKVFRGTIHLSPSESSHDEIESSLQESLLEKGLVPLSATYPGIHFFVLNFHPHIPFRLCWVFSTKDPDFPQLEQRRHIVSLVNQHETDNSKKELILAILEKSAEDSFSSCTETKVTDFKDETLESFHGRWGGKGRITLIGDAAHAMRPTDGQGGNMAFEDALVLCRLLGTELARSAEPERVRALLEEFEKARLPRVKRMHDNQRLRYEARMKGERVGPWTSEFEEWARNGV